MKKTQCNPSENLKKKAVEKKSEKKRKMHINPLVIWILVILDTGNIGDVWSGVKKSSMHPWASCTPPFGCMRVGVHDR